jgi:hypothetical protein
LTKVKSQCCKLCSVAVKPPPPRPNEGFFFALFGVHGVVNDFFFKLHRHLLIDLQMVDLMELLMMLNPTLLEHLFVPIAMIDHRLDFNLQMTENYYHYLNRDVGLKLNLKPVECLTHALYERSFISL